MAKQKTKPGALLLGIFIGLVLGLGIAIVVALFVTKTASKVTSKYSHTEKASERDASKPLPDPNKSLYAQTGSGEVTSEKEIKTRTDSKHEQVANKRDNKAAQPSEKDGAEAKQRKEWRYFLQAGAYLNEDEAENVRAQLAFMGLEASVSERWSAQGTLHRVRTGPFTDVDEMNQVRLRLIQSGFKPSVIRLEIKNKP